MMILQNVLLKQMLPPLMGRLLDNEKEMERITEMSRRMLTDPAFREVNLDLLRTRWSETPVTLRMVVCLAIFAQTALDDETRKE